MPISSPLTAIISTKVNNFELINRKKEALYTINTRLNDNTFSTHYTHNTHYFHPLLCSKIGKKRDELMLNFYKLMEQI